MKSTTSQTVQDSLSEEDFQKVVSRVENHIVSKNPPDGSGCWLTDFRSNPRYPAVTIRAAGKVTNIPAARIMYQHHYGKIPAEILVCHTCSNAFCINPKHLFLASHQEKVNITVAQNKQAKGSRLPQAKLTETEVIEIKALIEEDELSLKSIAQMFGVTVRTVTDIKSRRCWKSVN